VRRRDDVDIERDRALVERCQRGDTSAFDDLYLRYYDRLVRYCFRRLGDTTEAEDAAQEAFARAWKAMPGFEGERRFYPWLSVIASNLCVDMIRHNARIAPAGEDLEKVLAPVEGGQEASLEQGDERALLEQALGRISPRHREVLQLREGYEWSYQRIAEHQGVQVSTIETLLFRARRSLRREYLILAEGQAGLAGFLLFIRNLVGRGVRRLVPHHARAAAPHSAGAPASASGSGAVSSTTAATSSAAASAASASTGTAAGVLPAAAGFVVAAAAAAAITVAASMAPHPARAAGTGAAAPRSAAVAAVSAQDLLPLAPRAASARSSSLPGGGRAGQRSGTTSETRATRRASARSGSRKVLGGRLPGGMAVGATVGQVGTIAGTGGTQVVSALNHVSSAVQNLLGKTTSAVSKTQVGSAVHKVVKSVTKTVTTVAGNNPVSGILNGLGGTGSTGSAGNTGTSTTLPGGL
jgi:RNA polymerase sigma-70 factor (ECF subfamily)